MKQSAPGKVRIIAGHLRGRKVPVLPIDGLRPTPDRVRETLFNWLQTNIQDAKCYVFFAGTGVLGFEAISRGAAHVVMVDNNRAICDSLKKTQVEFGIEREQCIIEQSDVLSYIQRQLSTAPADLIFLDPPFNSSLLEEALALLSQSSLLGPQTMIYTELSSDSPVPTLKHFEPIKTQKAGKVAYHLLAQKSES